MLVSRRRIKFWNHWRPKKQTRYHKRDLRCPWCNKCYNQWCFKVIKFLCSNFKIEIIIKKLLHWLVDYNKTIYQYQYQFYWKCGTAIMQRPLNIWTENSNCQIHSRGDSKTLIALLIPNIFLIFTDEKKAEGMTKFDIFHVFVENSVNSEFCLFWALLKPAKIWNLPKNACVWAA